VDDLLLTANDKKKIEKIKSKLIKKYGNITVKNSLVQKYLGMILDFSIRDQVNITMKNPIMEII
jgi:hypothetical protein